MKELTIKTITNFIIVYSILKTSSKKSTFERVLSFLSRSIGSGRRRRRELNLRVSNNLNAGLVFFHHRPDPAVDLNGVPVRPLGRWTGSSACRRWSQRCTGRGTQPSQASSPRCPSRSLGSRWPHFSSIFLTRYLCSEKGRKYFESLS